MHKALKYIVLLCMLVIAGIADLHTKGGTQSFYIRVSVKETDFIESKIYLFSFTSCIFIARTLEESPNRLIKPSASWWSYKSPVVKEAMLSL